MLGAVQVHGDQIDLLDGQLALVVRVPHEQGAAEGLLHFHVRATPRNRKADEIDLCIVGTQHADAVSALTDRALPPLVSAIRQRPVLGALHAWSDTANGIPGHSAYFGDFYVRGDANNPGFSSLLEDGLFEDVPPLPRDGRLHVVKVTVLSKEGALLRTIELDGATTLEEAHALKVRSSVPGMLVVFAVLDSEPDPLNDERAGLDARQRLAAHPPWLPDPQACPAKLLPATPAIRPWDPVAARGGRLLHAVRGCEAGAVELCYAAAQELIDEDPRSPAAESLFVRACQLGSASGCTNAAAGRVPDDDCAFETFEASCNRGHDPWGCTMLGAALARGDAKYRDLRQARAVLQRSCVYGPADAACQVAKRLLDSLPSAQ